MLCNTIRFVKPKYVYLRLIPNKSVRNTQTARILQFVAEIAVHMNDQINFDFKNRYISIEEKSKFAYYIYLSKESIEFYFIVSEKYVDLITQRIDDVWKKLVTVQIVEDIPRFETYSFYLDYKYEDALSTRTDSRDNDLLTSLLNSASSMKSGDKAGILFNFTPFYQQGWLARYNKTIDKIDNNECYYKNKITPLGLLFTINDLLIKFLDALFQRKPVRQSTNFLVSDYTREKKKATIVCTEIVCAGNNKDVNVSLCEAFHILDNDNQIVKYGKNKKLDYDKYHVSKHKMLTSTREAQSFVSLPGDTLLKEHKIEHVNISESKVPEELQHGYIRLGTNQYHGTDTPAYMMDDIEIGTMPIVLLGEQGAGKTTALGNFAYDAQSRGECVIVIDFIKNNEMCDTIKAALKGRNVLDIDLSDIDNSQGLGYNELKPRSNKAKDIVSCANQKATYISRLIDSIGNKSNKSDDLSSRMDKYLSAASNIVMVNESASLRDVVRCLNDYEYRDKCIKALRKDVAQELAEEIIDLRELDDNNDKTGKVEGTRYSKIDGVNDRISKLRKDYRLKKMFNADCKNNIDLIEAMESGKVILFRMPQSEFPTPYSRNVITTYLLTKIWAAGIARGSMHKTPLRSHIIIDEIFQAPTAMDLINNEQIIPQTRKFQIQFMLTAQYKKQIDTIFDSLHNAGASYLLMKGSGKSHFDEFKDMITPFTLDDMQSLKQYHSLNIINTNDGRKVFETALPKPL